MTIFLDANQVDVGADLHSGRDVPGPHNGYCSDPVINVFGEDRWSADLDQHCFVKFIINDIDV